MLPPYCLSREGAAARAQRSQPHTLLEPIREVLESDESDVIPRGRQIREGAPHVD